jgi:hypothetical protein
VVEEACEVVVLDEDRVVVVVGKVWVVVLDEDRVVDVCVVVLDEVWVVVDEVWVVELDEVWVVELEEVWVVELEEVWVVELEEIWVVELDEVWVLVEEVVGVVLDVDEIDVTVAAQLAPNRMSPVPFPTALTAMASSRVEPGLELTNANFQLASVPCSYSTAF